MDTDQETGPDHPEPCIGYFCKICFPDDWSGTYEIPPRPKPFGLT